MSSKLSLIVASVIAIQLTQILSLPTTQDECKCLKTHPETQYSSSQLYVFGGGTVENKADKVTDTASRLNSSTGKWESINSMLSAEESFCGAAVDKQIYLFGGFAANIQQNHNYITAAAEVYDCLTDTYTILRPMSEPRCECGAAALNDSIYVAGGFLGPSFNTSASFIRYDIHSNQWSTLTSMNNARKYLQLVEMNELLYAIGGEASKSVEVYNSKTDRWSFVANTQYSHESFGAAVHEGKIYVYSQNGFEVYSPNNNQWTTLNTPNDPYLGTRLVTMNGKLWALGGRYTTDAPNTIQTKRVYTYDPATDRWTKQHDMDVPRAFHTAFVVNH